MASDSHTDRTGLYILVILILITALSGGHATEKKANDIAAQIRNLQPCVQVK